MVIAKIVTILIFLCCICEIVCRASYQPQLLLSRVFYQRCRSKWVTFKLKVSHIVMQPQNDFNHQTDDGSEPSKVSLLVRGYSALTDRFLDWASVVKGVTGRNGHVVWGYSPSCSTLTFCLSVSVNLTFSDKFPIIFVCIELEFKLPFFAWLCFKADISQMFVNVLRYSNDLLLSHKLIEQIFIFSTICMMWFFFLNPLSQHHWPRTHFGALFTREHFFPHTVFLFHFKKKWPCEAYYGFISVRL